MDHKQKTFQVLKAISHAAELAPKGKLVYLHKKDSNLKGITPLELSQVINKLSDELKAIKVEYRPEWSERGDSFRLEFLGKEYQDAFELKLTKKFPEIYAQYETKCPQSVIKQTEKRSNPKKSETPKGAAFWVEYTKSREVLLNGTLILAKPRFDSENDLVFSYLMEHPNKKIRLKEIEEKATRQQLSKKFHQIINDLGFSGNLRKAFFDASGDTILFRKSLFVDNLRDLGLTL